MSFKNKISRRVAQIQHLWMGRPDYVIFFGHGIGDDLLCSAVARELKKRGAGKIVMFSKYPSLFERNPDILGTYNFGLATIGRRWHWGYKGIVPQYSVAGLESDRDIFRNKHILATMCRIAGMTGTIELRPYLSLGAEEKTAGKLFERQAVIQSAGLATGPGVMKNKDWFPERFQGVCDALGNSIKLIQLGQMTDPPIRGALDLRGKTTLRESAAILASSCVFIGLVGFLMHLARAVDCRSVIVYGGREAPSVSGYEANENIVGRTVCSPCWQRNKCDYDRECMRMIREEDVIAAVQRQMTREGFPLEVGRTSLEPTLGILDSRISS
jgi:hypothetical protein